LNRRGITIDADEASAITGLLAILGSYLMPNGSADGANAPAPPAPPPAQPQI
jgi:hypothetical protein